MQSGRVELEDAYYRKKDRFMSSPFINIMAKQQATIEDKIKRVANSPHVFT